MKKNILYVLSLVTALNFTTAAQTTASNPKVLTAPAFYDIIIPRLEVNPELLYDNLYYEGNNIIMRNIKNEKIDVSLGEFISKNWRKSVEHTKAAFVLRDALFSQQDHPYKFKPFAIMLPANWITAAALQNDSIQTVTAPPIHDDEAWRNIKTPQQMFGSFPISESLFKLASGNPDHAADTIYTYNARETLRILSEYSRRLADKRKSGLEAMIEEGAKIIAESDTLYFGKEIRKNHIIPIMVENPTRHEILEGKGISLDLNDTHHAEVISAIRKILYKQRLAYGDIALERYDISNPGERKRAVKVLEELIPKGSSGATIWLWVTGRLLKNKTLQGEDASAYITQFQKEIYSSDINTSRLRFVNKPYITLPKKNAVETLRESTVRLRKLDLFESVNITGGQLQKIIANHK